MCEPQELSFMRNLLMLATINGFLAVSLGAFGAHGLASKWRNLSDAAQRMSWWETASHYHIVHAFAIALAALMIPRIASGLPSVAGYLFVVGILLFSGSLYTMALSGVRVLGAVTPVGGICLLAGWGLLFLSTLKMESR